MRRMLTAGFVAALTGTAGAGRATAQEKPPVLPPLEVVATRIPMATHDVPAAIEVIRGSDLRARNATTLRDALALAAGVAIAPGGDGGPAGSVPEFWGLREFDAFLLVVDGVPWGGAFNPALATLDLSDVDHIEILRGPAPVTYGATSFVGVIHVVHNAASHSSRRVSARGGSYGSGGLSFAAGSTTGSWNTRVSGGFDRESFKDDRTGLSRGRALLRASKGSTWITGDVTILRQDPASPHPREGPALSDQVPLDANHNPDKAFLNENRFFLSGGWQRGMKNGSSWGTTLSFTHSTNKQFRGFLTDLSNSPDNAAGFRENIDINDLYADTHLIWASHAKLQFLTGVDALFANGEAKGATFSYTVPLDGSTAAPVTEPTTFDKDAEARRLFVGAYASADWRPVDRLTLSGGLRLNGTTERRGEGESVSHGRLSGSVGLLLGLWEKDAGHLRLYANFKDTFKPAAFDFSLAENEGVLDPETSQSWEGGIKARTPNGRIDFELSAFRMNFENMVTATIVNNLPALQNTGKTRFQGVELATDLRLRTDLSARASYGFHDGKFVDFVQDFDGTNTQLAGKRFEMSARHLASGGLTYAPASGLLLTGTVNYTGDRYLNKRNTALAGGFTTFDAGIGYRLRRAEFRVDGRNLGNRRDAVSESEFGDAQYYRMPARTIQGSIALSF